MALFGKVKKSTTEKDSTKKESVKKSKKIAAKSLYISDNSKNQYYSLVNKTVETEKVNTFAKNKIVLSVKDIATKQEIKKICESYYKVKVLGINIINTPAKEKRKGRNIGWKKGYKKAIITFISEVKANA